MFDIKSFYEAKDVAEMCIRDSPIGFKYPFKIVHLLMLPFHI